MDANLPTSKTPGEPRWRRPRFRLRHFLILLAALSIPLASWLNSARRQRNAVAAISRAGGQVYYDFQVGGTGQTRAQAPFARQEHQTRLRRMLSSVLGRDYISSVTFVSLMPLRLDGKTAPEGTAIAIPEELGDVDALIEDLASLPRLKVLRVHGLQFTDEQLEAIIRQHPELETLDLNASVLRTCTEIRATSYHIRVARIHCDDRSFGNAGLAHLKRLESLRRLVIHSAHLDDESLRIIGAIPSLRAVRLADGTFTDAGLAHLGGLQSLGELDLRPARGGAEGSPMITMPARERLKSLIPKLRLDFIALPPVPPPVAGIAD